VQVFLLLSERFQWFAFNEKKGWTVLTAVGVVCVAVLVVLLWGLVCLCLRRRFQFGVRSLLVIVVVLSVPLGWFAWETQRARRQREAVEAIKRADGRVLYDCEFDENGDWWGPGIAPRIPAWMRKLLGHDFFAEVVEIYLSDPDDAALSHVRKIGPFKTFVSYRSYKVTDIGLANFEGLTRLEVLALPGAQVTDAGLVHLKRLTLLQTLDLSGTDVTDAGLPKLKALTKLKSLGLCRTQVTDAGLVHLKELTNMESLGLEETQVTDAGLVHLRGLAKLEMVSLLDTQVSDTGLAELKTLPKLKWLSLSRTHITDDGLTHLTVLTNLETLYLSDTRATDEGIEKLQRALPNTKIEHGPLPW
jgi:hypothetical protein